MLQLMCLFGAAGKLRPSSIALRVGKGICITKLKRTLQGVIICWILLHAEVDSFLSFKKGSCILCNLSEKGCACAPHRKDVGERLRETLEIYKKILKDVKGTVNFLGIRISIIHRKYKMPKSKPDEKHNVPDDPPSYDETMKQDAADWAGFLRSSVTPGTSSGTANNGYYHVHNPNPRSKKGYPGSERSTYNNVKLENYR